MCAWFIMVCALDIGVRMLTYRCMTVCVMQALHCTAKVVKANNFHQADLGTRSAARCRLLAGRQAYGLSNSKICLPTSP